MRWLLAGLCFALTVGLAVASAAIESDNIRLRRRIELLHVQATDRLVELRRRAVQALEQEVPEALAARLRAAMAAAGTDST